MRGDFERNIERFREEAAYGDQVAVAGMALVTSRRRRATAEGRVYLSRDRSAAAGRFDRHRRPGNDASACGRLYRRHFP